MKGSSIFYILIFVLIVPNWALSQSKANFYTNYGTFQAILYDTIAPITAGNFISLIDEEFYDGVIFHRIIDGFVIQGGDPTGTGNGGPGYTIEDEFGENLSNVVTTLSMANSGPNTGGSQFFINLVDNTFLDHDQSPLSSAHPVFGHINKRWDYVQIIEDVPVDGSDRPIDDVVMDSVRIIERYYPDEDNDGFASDVDCDDENPSIFPGAEEIVNNDIDEDCDGEDLMVSVYDELFSKINISPNPCYDICFINQLAFYNITEIKIYSVDGNLIKTKDSGDLHFNQLFVKDYKSGIYFVHFKSDSQSKRIIKLFVR